MKAAVKNKARRIHKSLKSTRTEVAEKFDKVIFLFLCQDVERRVRQRLHQDGVLSDQESISEQRVREMARQAIEEEMAS